ncbi:MAG TPA: ATP-binding protein [Rhizomicrobium sp.]|nr:ATP-binding protein [Rhizomicrobium sp.]
MRRLVLPTPQVPHVAEAKGDISSIASPFVVICFAMPPIAAGLAALDEIFSRLPKWQLAAACGAVSALLVIVQLATGATLTVLYAIPISILAWYAGSLPALCLSVIAILVTASVSYFHGVLFRAMPAVLEIIRLFFFVFLSQVIPALRSLQSLAKDRDLALAREIAAHRKLEQEMLDSAERKQRGIGRDMHDGLSQHLVATAMVSYAHARKLSADGSEEAEKAYRVHHLIEQAIVSARSISEALHPIEMSGNDLMSALEKFSSTTSELFGLECRFECPVPVIVDSPTAEHLFRITQEGVSNAIRHGRATKIDISLQEMDTNLVLSISDNGIGLPHSLSNRKGMGLQIMAARSQFIGGRFSLSPKAVGGTNLTCLVPIS